jgi:hypothetical protein
MGEGLRTKMQSALWLPQGVCCTTAKLFKDVSLNNPFSRQPTMNPIANYNSALEIVFALNAMTYLFSIEPSRRGELLGLFNEFKQRVPEFDSSNMHSVRGHLILAHYGAAHLSLSIFSLLFATIAVGFILYGAAEPAVLVPTRWMVPGVTAMLTVVPFGSIWLTFVCKTQFEKYLAGFPA